MSCDCLFIVCLGIYEDYSSKCSIQWKPHHGVGCSFQLWVYMTFYNLLESYMDLGAFTIYETIILKPFSVAYTGFSEGNFNNLYLMSLVRFLLWRMFKDFLLFSLKVLSNTRVSGIRIHNNYLPKLLVIWTGNVRELIWDPLDQVGDPYELSHTTCPNC